MIWLPTALSCTPYHHHYQLLNTTSRLSSFHFHFVLWEISFHFTRNMLQVILFLGVDGWTIKGAFALIFVYIFIYLSSWMFICSFTLYVHVEHKSIFHFLCITMWYSVIMHSELLVLRVLVIHNQVEKWIFFGETFTFNFKSRPKRSQHIRKVKNCEISRGANALKTN